MKKVLIALGGNALGNNPTEQLNIVKETAKSIVDLAQAKYEVVVCHGNGPQVGVINQAMEYSSTTGPKTPYMPFAECGAMSQGYIGYHLQQAIGDELRSRGLNKDCATIITQTVVDHNDLAFQNPTKPVGSFYSKEQADEITKDRGFTFVEDSGRGYRRVVPSPKPTEIIESKVIESLVDGGVIVISSGGGGIPVVKEGGLLKGVDAVIDKDLSSAKLALQLKADVLLILTAVEQVFVNFNTPQQKAISEMTISQAEQYIEESQFAKGSMLPKIEACLNFVRSAEKGSKAIVTSLEQALRSLSGETGTVIISD